MHHWETRLPKTPCWRAPECGGHSRQKIDDAPIMRHRAQRVQLPLQRPQGCASATPGLAPPAREFRFHSHIHFASWRLAVAKKSPARSTPHPDPRQHSRRTTYHSTSPLAAPVRIAQVLTRPVYHHGYRQGPRQARQGHPRSRPHRYVASPAPRTRIAV